MISEARLNGGPTARSDQHNRKAGTFRAVSQMPALTKLQLSIVAWGKSLRHRLITLAIAGTDLSRHGLA